MDEYFNGIWISSLFWIFILMFVLCINTIVTTDNLQANVCKRLAVTTEDYLTCVHHKDADKVFEQINKSSNLKIKLEGD